MNDETKEGFVKLKMPKYYIAKHSDEDLQAAVLAEREACAKLCLEQDEYGCGQYAKAIRARDMSKKPQNIDTSAERVHEIDKSVHEDDDIQEYKKPWVSLTDEEIEVIAKRLVDDKTYFSLHFAVAIQAKLKEKNT